MSDERKGEVREYLRLVRTEEEGVGFDLVLSNPPFSMAYKRDNEDEERILRQRGIAKAKTSAKSNILFLDRYCELLKNGGEMLIVIDDTVLNGDTCMEERRWILENFVVIGVHSLPFNAFFKAQANIKTSIIHVRKKRAASDAQGHVFMSISNNIGHDNSLKDTPERNNLSDILAAYFEWRRTGRLAAIAKNNQDPEENLECPEQIWLVPPEKFRVERFDAFAYAPELNTANSQIDRLAAEGKIKAYYGRDFVLKKKLTRGEKVVLGTSGKVYKYIEISDVTTYGLILTHLSAQFKDIPSRAEYVISEGDILMAINNSSRGTVVIVPKEYDGALCTSGFLVISPRTREEGLLLWFSLRSELARKQVYYLAQTASQPELKIKAWRESFRVPMPAGSAARQAIRKAEEFQAHLSALLEADKFTLQ